MPHTLTDSPQFDTVVVPDGTDKPRLASLLPGLQALTNRSAYAKSLLDTGVKKIRTFQNLTQLIGYDSPADGENCLLIDKGIYRYDASSTLATNVYIVQPSSVGGSGRWIHVDAGLVGLAGGLASLDANAHVPAAQLAAAALVDNDGKILASQTRGSFLAESEYSRSTSYNGTIANSSTYQSLYGDGITQADVASIYSVTAGDLLLVTATIEVAFPASTSVFRLALGIQSSSSVIYPAGSECTVTGQNGINQTVSLSTIVRSPASGVMGASAKILGVSGSSYITPRCLISFARIGSF